MPEICCEKCMKYNNTSGTCSSWVPCRKYEQFEPREAKPDPVNHPSHYKFPGGVEVIQLTRHLTFNRGNAVKYLCRAGKKDDELQDLQKALFYVQDEIKRLT